MTTLLQSQLPNLPVRRGKVRDVYDLGDQLLLVATDRISAFDWVLPTGIPDKGRVLTQLTPLLVRASGRAEPPAQHRRGRDGSAGVRRPGRRARRPVDAGAQGRGRADRVRRARLPRRAPAGRSIRRRGTVCGIDAAAGLDGKRAAAGADLHAGDQGRDRARREHLASTRWSQLVGTETGEAAARPEPRRSTARRASTRAQRGIIIADTKFEFGRLPSGELILIDEVLTPDSSRFWPADQYQPGRGQPSFDKQFVRDWLETTELGQEQPAAAAAGRRRGRRRGTNTSRRMNGYRASVSCEEFPMNRRGVVLLACLCSLLATISFAPAQGTRETTTYRRIKAALDAVPAIDTHDHLWPFDRLPGYVETEHGRGMNLASLWQNSYYTLDQPAHALEARHEVRRLVGEGQARLRQRPRHQLLPLPAARLPGPVRRRLRPHHRRAGPRSQPTASSRTTRTSNGCTRSSPSGPTSS